MRLKKENGITLVALVVTIIVMIILLGVSVGAIRSGIFTNSKNAMNRYSEGVENEIDKKDLATGYLENKMGISGGSNSGKNETGGEGNDTNWSEDKNVNKPKLTDDMIPVYWDASGNEIETTKDDPNWYDYYSNKWANVKTTKDGSYWVWIPRYEYKLYSPNANYDHTKAGKIEVNFIKTTKKSPTGGYVIHPSFTNDIEHGGWDSEISGFWIAKYEMSPERTTNSGATWAAYTVGNVATSSTTYRMVSKPNVASWRSINIANCYTNSYNYDRSKESHLIKNGEWGAVAYLTHSKYGRDGVEIYANNSSTGITGNSAGSTYAYSGTTTYEYNTPKGILASTTGNISGVYDFSGGSAEYVAAFNAYYSGTYYTGTAYKNTLGTHFASSSGTSTKYATAYKNNTNEGTWKFTVGEVSYTGDAIHEVYIESSSLNFGWFSDNCEFVNSTNPFLVRGGAYESKEAAGIFSSRSFSGQLSGSHSFRVVLIP